MGEADDMRQIAEVLDKMNENIAGMYAKRTGKDTAHWRGLMSAETWFTAEEAKAEGLVDSVYSSTKKKNGVRAAFDFKIYNNIPAPVQEMWGIQETKAKTEPAVETAAPATALSNPKDLHMADSLSAAAVATVPAAASPVPSQLEQFTEQAKQGWIDRGRALGIAEGDKVAVDRFREIVTASQGRFDIAANSFLSGQTASTVALIVNAANSESQKNQQKLAEMEINNRRLEAQLATGGHQGVSFTPALSNAPSAPSNMEPEAQAELEYDGSPAIRHANPNRKAWMLYRVNALKGNVNVFAPKAN